jgi:hypothetical protein
MIKNIQAAIKNYSMQPIYIHLQVSICSSFKEILTLHLYQMAEIEDYFHRSVASRSICDSISIVLLWL